MDMPEEKEESRLMQILAAAGLMVVFGILFGALALALLPKPYEPTADCIGFSRVERDGDTIKHTCYGMIVPEASEDPPPLPL